MDAISYSHSVKQEKRIKKIIADPDSNSGIVTVPKVIGAGESVTIPAGRVAVLPNVQVDGTLNIEGEVFIPSGSIFGKVVETEGNQTIDGIKTFTSSPIVPTPTAGIQAVNKDYADLKVALTDFTGVNQSKLGSGYQKLPGGLIIQWGLVEVNGSSFTSFNFPISFPNNYVGLYNGRISVGAGGGSVFGFSSPTKTGAVVYNADTTPSSRTEYYLAIGY